MSAKLLTNWRWIRLIFIVLAKFRQKPTMDEINMTSQRIQKGGAKTISAYWTLGRYDTVFTIEAPDEKAMMKTLLEFGDTVNSETLVAVPREEALKLL
jgi:uncharacterized protein with GYD domain